MEQVTYETRVTRHRGKWRVSVPALPDDAPVVVTTQLGNAAPELIAAVARYLGVSPQVVAVDVQQPTRARRRTLRDLISAQLVQVSGGAGALAAVYLSVGATATLAAASIGALVLGALRESGRI